MSLPAPAPRISRDRWPLGLFALHVAHGLWFAHLYPAGVWDPDLVAYFIYFENWVAGIRALHTIDYFTVPKPLLVFVLGPLGSAAAAFAISTVVAGPLRFSWTSTAPRWPCVRARTSI